MTTPVKINLNTLAKMKTANEKIAMLTAYDASFARVMDEAGVEIVLVGDSLGNVVQGHPTTVPVTIEDVAYHLRCVRRGLAHAFLIGDIPFMSYATRDLALNNAAHLMRAGAEMVKMEGGKWLCDVVSLLTQNGIAVCGHLGLQPQSVHVLGGYGVHGREEARAQEIFNDAVALQEAGAKLLVLECVPRVLAEEITLALKIPVIGIGAGEFCDGQVLVLHDLLGVSSKTPPSFVKTFMPEYPCVPSAIRGYVNEVKEGKFPLHVHGFE